MSNGGLAEAIKSARTLAKLEDDVEIELWPRDLSLLEVLQGGNALEARTLPIKSRTAKEVMSQLRVLEELAESRVPLAHAPYWFSIE